jgi:glycosyltransferase involved in cell wall biosynthesis
MSDQPQAKIHTVSIVIPVYQGEHTLGGLVAEIAEIAQGSQTRAGVPFRIAEVILVYDNGPDRSDVAIRALVEQYDFVRAIWLSRNFGQHAATLAGIASSASDWIVTLDEDGQHDPREIAGLLDAAISTRAQIVYGKPVNPPPHGVLRNAASKSAKALVSRLLVDTNAADFNSYRLVLGSVGRGVAAYAGSGVYLDVALGWVAGNYTTAPVTLRAEGRQSGYSLYRLISHFLRLLLTSGTRGLRLVSILGMTFAILGVLLALWIIVIKLTTGISAQGFAATTVILLITSGAILFSLGIVAEYIGVSVNMAMGKPAYVITTDPNDGPLGSAAAPETGTSTGR